MKIVREVISRIQEELQASAKQALTNPRAGDPSFNYGEAVGKNVGFLRAIEISEEILRASLKGIEDDKNN